MNKLAPLLILLLPVFIFVQAPQGLNYQAIAWANLEYYSDHWIQQREKPSNGLYSLGHPSEILGVDEVYAQIMIQKIK